MTRTRTTRILHLGIVLAGALATQGVVRWFIVAVLTFTLFVMVPHLERIAHQNSQQLIKQDLVRVVDQLCLYLSAGMTIPIALARVSSAGDSRAHQQLLATVQLYAIGQDLHSSVETLVEQDAQWLPLVRMIQRSIVSGASLTDQLGQYCDFVALEAHSAAIIRVRRVGVKAVLPLAFCFLPAFFTLTIVPIVISIVSSLTL